MKLKKYNKYLNKLIDYAVVCDVKVIYKNIPQDEGSFSYSDRTIELDENLSESNEIATFLHELGHFIDDALHPKFTRSKKAEAAYYSYNCAVPLTKPQRKVILDQERRAWEGGEGLARQLKIKLGKWYYKEMKEGLNAYRKG